MQFRVGKCSSCGATFKVPASFGGEKAKCKSCGTGVVVIGPVEGGEETLEEYEPSGKKGGGPSMMERLRAERAAAEARPVPAKKPAASRPATKKPAAEKPAAKKPPRPVVRRGAAKGTAGPADAPERPSRGRPTSRGSRSGARRAGRTRSRRGHDDDEDEDAGGRHGRTRKKKSPALLIGGLLLIIAAGIVAWQVMDDGSTEAADNTDQQVVTAGDSESTSEDKGTEDSTTETDTEGTDEGTADVDTAAEEEEPEPTQPAQKVTESTPDSEVDPNEIDLSAFEPLPKDPQCSDEEWDRIVELVRTMADQDSPRQANQAVEELSMIGRFAYPAMVNEFLKLDLTTYEDHRQGDYYQRAMETLLGGRNYGWKYDFDEEPNKTALFNKKVARNYYKTASKIAGKPNAWNDLSKNENNTNRPDPEAEEEEEIGLSNDDLDDLDDIDF